ncbi:uncharacterized protein LOC127078519 [Lathyrus oleraceus]|uniref:uncharacterized protein LOC127078519 n=1 Tax=Pisum sativum TaxID=3888 RepID=UPI0021CF4763|nr:uncharacterized protein LOC127078519 [Pisum sativum]
MSEDNDPKGAYNRAPVFKGENDIYWKLIMYVHLLSVDKNLRCAVTEGLYIPKGDNSVVKQPKDWTDDETKKASYDLKAKNIIILAISAKAFYSISHHTSTKGIWDALQTLYEGTKGVKDSKINMFTEEFKLFRTKPGEFVDSMQTRFLYLINKLRDLVEHENELKLLANSKVNSKKNEKGKEEKRDLSLKASSSKVNKSKEESDDSDEEASKKEEMDLFVRRCNRSLKRNKLKHTDKCLVNFRNTHPPKKDHKKQDDEITCYECGKLVHYRTTCTNPTKHHKRKDKASYKTKGKSSKSRRAYIAWEKEVESFSSDSCSSSDDECAKFFLMARKKNGTSKVYNSESENEYTYGELSSAFNAMCADSIKAFKNIALQKEIIDTLEHDINNLNRALKCLKEVHTSHMEDRCIVLDTLAEKIEVVECVNCPILKTKIETLRGYLTHATTFSNTCYSFSSERRKVFKKNPHLTRRNRRSVSSKAICHYCGDKSHIRPFCHVRKIEVPNGKITSIPKCNSNNPEEPTS